MPTSSVVAAALCLISLVVGAVVGMTVASQKTSFDPSAEFSLTVFNAEQMIYVLDWSAGKSITIIDRDRDGVIDWWELSEDNRTIFKVKDLNNDHKLDYWWRRTDSEHGVLAEDLDYDGTPDSVKSTVTVTKY